MNDYNPNDVLKKALTHSTSLKDCVADLNKSPLECGFRSIQQSGYLLKERGRLVVLAARPGNGKTAFSCQLGINIAKHSRVLMFSLEMSKEALKERMLGVIGSIPIAKLGEKVFKTKVEAAEEEIAKLKFDIVDNDALSAEDIVRMTIDENNKEKLGLVIIDYVGIIKVDNNKRALAVGEAAELIKNRIAKRLNIPVLMLAQMKRGFEDRYAKARFEYEKAKNFPNGANRKILDVRPTMEDIGESSKLEHASDVIMFLQRPCLLDPEEPQSLFRVYVVKNRHGEAKDFELEFSATMTKFSDRESL